MFELCKEYTFNQLEKKGFIKLVTLNLNTGIFLSTSFAMCLALL